MQKTTCISFSLYNSFSFDFGVKFSDSSCTYEVLKFGDLLFQNVSSHFIVFYHTADLQLFDAVADRNQLRSSPQEAVHLYGAHALLQLRHFGLVIPLINEKPYLKLRNYTWHFKDGECWSSRTGLTSSRMEDLAMRVGFLAFLWAYSFTLSALIRSASSSSSSLPNRSISSSSAPLCSSTLGFWTGAAFR